MSLLVKTKRSSLSSLLSDPTVALIPLGDGRFAIIDKEDEERIAKYKWFAHRSRSMLYAMRKVTSKNSVYYVRMHRQIMHTPQGLITHHKNRNPLDNRKENLQNMTDEDHDTIHGKNHF
ncbi:hypothetical protein KAR91_35435 [Candidatus Pacearchaeota archaeon]|nr:hypothetical protein [Candidatus Pacearchaeota archaeon]